MYIFRNVFMIVQIELCCTGNLFPDNIKFNYHFTSRRAAEIDTGSGSGTAEAETAIRGL